MDNYGILYFISSSCRSKFVEGVRKLCHSHHKCHKNCKSKCKLAAISRFLRHLIGNENQECRLKLWKVSAIFFSFLSFCCTSSQGRMWKSCLETRGTHCLVQLTLMSLSIMTYVLYQNSAQKKYIKATPLAAVKASFKSSKVEHGHRSMFLPLQES